MTTIYLPHDMDERLMNAFRYFGLTRSDQIEKQKVYGRQDQGNRGAATGGKQLDGFVNLVYDLLALNGVPKESIFTKSDLELPGFFRPNKKWDLLVVHEHKLIAAIEFKSQVGPSFGNNFNNRTEEALGSSLDIWTAYKNGVFGIQPAPWIGYFMVLDDCKKSNEPINARSPHFKVLNEFTNASYKERYEIFCNKLLLERRYSAACFAVTSYVDDEVSYSFPQSGLSFQTFSSSLLGTVASLFYHGGEPL